MDDLPRSSKRRKLDNSKCSITSPLRKRSAKDIFGKLNKISISHANRAGESTHERAFLSPKESKDGTPLKRVAAHAVDIYDDVEGALCVDLSTESIPPRLGTWSRDISASRDLTDNIQDNGNRTAKVAKTSLQSARSDHTPVQCRKGSRPRTKNTPVDKLVREGKTQGNQSNLELEDVNVTVPSKPLPIQRKGDGTRKRTAHREEQQDEIEAAPTEAVEEDTEMTEPDDKPAGRNKPKKIKSISSARRRVNHTDHFSNHDEEQRPDSVSGIDGLEHAADRYSNSVKSSLLDLTEPSPFNRPVSVRTGKITLPLFNNDLSIGQGSNLLKTILLERIAGKRPSPLVGLDEEYEAVYKLIERTITAGEGNSMLIIGARGSGKTTMVNKVLSEVSKENSGEYHVVRLNGFIHTDDKVALREIWRQLGKEMEIDEDGSGPGKNYADTLATLLALLSHPSEHTGEDTDRVARAVIFVMDEFDLFTQHPRQTLLYNLFDIAQSRKAPIAVLGLTTRIDTTDNLEKRVKSRFSHRYVHVSLAKTFNIFQAICRACLIVQPEQLSLEERGILQGGTQGTPAKKGTGRREQSVLAKWNANVETLFENPSFITSYLAPTFFRTKSIPSVLTSFLLPITTLCQSVAFTSSNVLAPPDSKLSIIPHLSTLALSLLIAAARLDIIHDSDTCNFNMAYDEYVTLASKARIQSAAGGMSTSSSTSKVWGKDVARREWEGLMELSFIMPTVAGQMGSFGMVKCDVALEEIGEVLGGEKGFDKGLEKWCRTI